VTKGLHILGAVISDVAHDSDDGRSFGEVMQGMNVRSVLAFAIAVLAFAIVALTALVLVAGDPPARDFAEAAKP